MLTADFSSSFGNDIISRPARRRFSCAADSGLGRYEQEHGIHGESRKCDKSLVSLNKFFEKEQHHGCRQNAVDMDLPSTHAIKGKAPELHLHNKRTNSQRNLPPRNLSKNSSHHSDPNHHRSLREMKPDVPCSSPSDNKKIVHGAKPQRSAQRHDHQREEKAPVPCHREEQRRRGSETKAVHAATMTTGRKPKPRDAQDCFPSLFDNKDMVFDAPSFEDDSRKARRESNNMSFSDAPSFEDDSRRSGREVGIRPKFHRRATFDVLKGSTEDEDNAGMVSVRRVVTLDSDGWPSRRGRAHRNSVPMGHGLDQRTSQGRERSRSASPRVRDQETAVSRSLRAQSPRRNERGDASPGRDGKATGHPRSLKEPNHREEPTSHKPRPAHDDLRRTAMTTKGPSVNTTTTTNKIRINPLLMHALLAEASASGRPCAVQQQHPRHDLSDQQAVGRDRRRPGQLHHAQGKRTLTKNIEGRAS